MRSNEVFARMTPEEAREFLEEVRKEAPEVATLALGAAASAFRLRAEFLKRQSPERQADWVRRALGRTAGASAAEEVLATYFLESHQDLLAELLDGLGVPHDEGRLEQEAPPSPEKPALEKAVKAFLRGKDRPRRRLLLRAFAAQSAIDWPDLEPLVP